MSRIRIVLFKDENDVTNTIAISSYAGKTVKAVAKCNPEDTFDMYTGVKLAETRCEVKIAKKRTKRAKQKYLEALDALNKAKKHFNDMAEYLIDANEKEKNAKQELNDLMEKLTNEEKKTDSISSKMVLFRNR